MDSERRAPRRVSKSPVRSRYADATRKSPMKERNSGNSALSDFDGGIVGVGGRTPRRGSKSPVRSRYADATRKSPMRERNLGDLDGHRKSPLRGRMSGDFDAQSKSSGRSTDADIRKSPLRRSVVAIPEEIQARDKVGAWVEHVKEEVGYVNKLVTQTDSFSGWLPGEATTGQNQVELNKPSASPRKQRTWCTEDPSMSKPGPDPVEEHGNMYGRRHAEVSCDDYGGVRRNTDLRFQDGYVQVLERPRGRMEQWEAERTGLQGVRGNGKPPGARHRVPINSYEPPSNYHSGSNSGYDELRGYRSHYNGPANLQNVAIKQAEILRKYNELGEEIVRIGDLSYSQGGRGEFYGDADDYMHDEFVRVRRGTVQSSGRYGSPRMMHNYIPGRPVPGPAVGHHEEDIRNFLPSRFMPNEFPFHDDPSSPQIPQRTTPNESHYYHQQFAPRRPMDPNYDPRTEYKTHPNRHTHEAPDYSDAYGKHIQDSTFRNPTPNNLSSHSRSSVGSKSDGGSSAHDRVKKVLAVNQTQQLCHPIAGGAPFVICSKCSQLLRLPKKLRTMKKNQCRLQCGSCRTISLFDFEKKKSPASFQTISKPSATDVPSDLVSKSDEKNHRHVSVADMANRESFDFNNTGYTFPCSDSEPSTELEDRRLNSNEDKMRPGLSPSSSHASKDDKSLEAVGQTDASSSKAEKPLTNTLLPLRPPPGSPLRYHMDYSDLLAAQESGGKEMDASGQDKGTAERDSTSLNYVENAAGPTTVASQGSTDASIRKDQGFQDPYLPSASVSPALADVYVNGQPITRDAVRSAEKMAGTISAGAYWYDKRAGFWGLMGSHCLGIIAPFIKEFKAPMPENCSGGDTCIYVNGRELHKNDLDLLSTRRLPHTRYKYYIVDISGKVEDEDTGRFVVSLGKLAPNVERTGRGFGMQPPEMHNG